MTDIERLQKGLTRLEKKFDRLYNRSYSRLTRRQDMDRKHLAFAKKLLKDFQENKPGMTSLVRRMGKLLHALKEGKHLIYLTKQERQKLLYLVKRTYDFKSRKQDLPIELISKENTNVPLSHL